MALRATSTFNLNKQAKRLLATELDPVKRNLMKKAFINAQLQSETKAPKESKSNRTAEVENV